MSLQLNSFDSSRVSEQTRLQSFEPARYSSIDYLRYNYTNKRLPIRGVARLFYEGSTSKTRRLPQIMTKLARLAPPKFLYLFMMLLIDFTVNFAKINSSNAVFSILTVFLYHKVGLNYKIY